jgi:hypothetical protein
MVSLHSSQLSLDLSNLAQVLWDLSVGSDLRGVRLCIVLSTSYRLEDANHGAIEEREANFDR